MNTLILSLENNTWKTYTLCMCLLCLFYSEPKHLENLHITSVHFSKLTECQHAMTWLICDRTFVGGLQRYYKNDVRFGGYRLKPSTNTNTQQQTILVRIHHLTLFCRWSNLILRTPNLHIDNRCPAATGPPLLNLRDGRV